MPDPEGPPPRDEGPSEADIARAERVAQQESRPPSAVKTAIWKYFVAAGVVVIIASLMVEFLIFLPARSGPTGERGELVSATVTRVIDGNTIAVSIGGSDAEVRYAGIRAPEVGQEFAGLAIQANRDWVSGRQVLLEADQADRDAAGRLLRYVYVDGVMVNAALVANGYAAVEPGDGTRRYQSDLARVEAEAREQKRGMWAGDRAARGGSGPQASGRALAASPAAGYRRGA
jgi:endonuclease YncB( thermonuclease family)